MDFLKDEVEYIWLNIYEIRFVCNILSLIVGILLFLERQTKILAMSRSMFFFVDVFKTLLLLCY